LLWEYRRSLPRDLGEYFAVPSINRNLAILGTSLIDTSSDNHLYTLDARTGSSRGKYDPELTLIVAGTLFVCALP
jgi:glucose dehydrogenase